MSELGQWLREAREAKGLSLAEVEAGTRIRSKFLTALEESNYDELPAEVYTRGFLRNYALYLGLDSAEALERYEKRETSRHGGELSLFRPLEVALFRTAVGRLRIRLLLLLLIVSAITAGLWAWRTGRLPWLPPLALFESAIARRATSPPSDTPTPMSQLATAVTMQETATPESTATPSLGATLSPTLNVDTPSVATPTVVASPTEPEVATTPPPTPTIERSTPTVTSEQPTAQSTVTSATELVTPSITLALDARVTVSIVVTDECWTEVTLDSLSEFRGLLTAGEQRAWQAQREIILRLGNAGGVQVTVNGDLLGTLGERQQVVEFAWGPEGEVTPQPTATATPEISIEALEVPIR